MSDQQKKISVVMAVYNGQRYIEEQLDSILNQTLKVNEILIFDDGSTDGTGNVIIDYKNNHSADVIVFQKNETRKGYALNFWDGMQKANGEIIFLCDQDDIWLEDKVELAIQILDQNPQIMSLNMAYQCIDSEGREIRNYKMIRFADNGRLRNISFRQFARSPKFPGMSMAIRKELYERTASVDRDCIVAHDWMLNQAAAFADSMYFLDRITAKYRQHKGNSYGMMAFAVKTGILKRRLQVIEDEKQKNEILCRLYVRSPELEYIKKLRACLLKREDLVRSKRLFGSLFYYLFHARYIAFRDLEGDVYAIINGK